MTPRPLRRLPARATLVAAALLGGCAITTVKTASGDTTIVPVSLIQEIAFDHGCQASGVILLRSSDSSASWTSYDLNVCGQVRRYKRVMTEGKTTWLDVTALYPPGSLPPPGK